MKKIVVVPKGRAFRAYLEADASFWAEGKNEQEAVGNFFCDHGRACFSIRVVREKSRRDPTEDDLTAAFHGAPEGDSFSRTRL